MRRTEILAKIVIAQLDDAIQNAPCIPLAVDETTDTTDNAKRDRSEVSGLHHHSWSSIHDGKRGD